MAIRVLDEKERIFEFWGSVEEIDADGEFVPMAELEPVMPVFMSRGGPLTLVHSGNVVGKALSYEFAEKEVKGKKVPAVKIKGQVFDNYIVDNLVWNAVKKMGQDGGATGSSWMGFVFKKTFDPEKKAFVLQHPEITSWGIVVGKKPDGTPIMPVNRSSTIIDFNWEAKSNADYDESATMLVKTKTGEVKEFELVPIVKHFPENDNFGVTKKTGNKKEESIMAEKTDVSVQKQEGSQPVTREEFDAFRNSVMQEISQLKQGKPEEGKEGKEQGPPGPGQANNPPGGGGGGGGGGGCFAAGTPVLTPEGFIAIEELSAGHSVLAFEGNKIVKAEVSEVFEVNRNHYYKVKAEGLEVLVTAEHPFYVGKGKYRAANALKLGDLVEVNKNGKLEMTGIEEVKRIDEHLKAFNLEVAGPHTFFAGGFAVHNKAAGSGLMQTAVARQQDELLKSVKVAVAEEVKKAVEGLLTAGTPRPIHTEKADMGTSKVAEDDPRHPEAALNVALGKLDFNPRTKKISKVVN